MGQGRQVEIQKKLAEITKKGTEWEQVMDRRISGGRLERYYFQEGGLCKTMFLIGSKTMVSGNWLVLR